MIYNTARPKLIISEYGRGVQQLVEVAKALPTKEERNKAANSLIELMAMLSPSNKEAADYKLKLWTHLFVIAGPEFDVDCPYEIKFDEILNRKPERIPYPQQKIKLKHYGKVVEKMIDAAIATQDEDLKAALAESIGNFMKLAYSVYHQTAVSDEEINADLKELSNGELELTEGVVLLKHRVPNHPMQNNQRRNNFQRGGNNNNKNKKFYNNGGKRRY